MDGIIITPNGYTRKNPHIKTEEKIHEMLQNYFPEVKIIEDRGDVEGKYSSTISLALSHVL